MSQSIVIIGAGPAGLTAAYELLKKGQVSVTILEATGEIGGISRTKNYKGNRMDIGGHRFFSKSDKAMDFWKEIMPLEDRERGISPDQADLLFLIRHRLSRILFPGRLNRSLGGCQNYRALGIILLPPGAAQRFLLN